MKMVTENILLIRAGLEQAFGDPVGIEIKLGEKNYKHLSEQMAGMLQPVEGNKVSFAGLVFSQ